MVTSHWVAWSGCSLLTCRGGGSLGPPVELSRAGVVGAKQRVPSNIKASPASSQRAEGCFERLQLDPAPLLIHPLTHGLAQAVQKQTLICFLCVWVPPPTHTFLSASFRQRRFTLYRYNTHTHYTRACTHACTHSTHSARTHAHTHTVSPHLRRIPPGTHMTTVLCFHRDV